MTCTDKSKDKGERTMWKKKAESFSYDAVFYAAILYLIMAVFIRENANWTEWILPVDITLGAFLAREIVTFVWFEDHPEEKSCSHGLPAG